MAALIAAPKWVVGPNDLRMNRVIRIVHFKCRDRRNVGPSARVIDEPSRHDNFTSVEDTEVGRRARRLHDFVACEYRMTQG